MRRRGSLGRVAVFGMALGVLPALAANLTAQNIRGENFVYVMTNKDPGNSVIQFSRAADRSLTWLREVPTGGNGTDANGADPLGSQDSLKLPIRRAL